MTGSSPPEAIRSLISLNNAVPKDRRSSTVRCVSAVPKDRRSSTVRCRSCVGCGAGVSPPLPWRGPGPAPPYGCGVRHPYTAGHRDPTTSLVPRISPESTIRTSSGAGLRPRSSLQSRLLRLLKTRRCPPTISPGRLLPRREYTRKSGDLRARPRAPAQILSRSPPVFRVTSKGWMKPRFIDSSRLTTEINLRQG